MRHQTGNERDIPAEPVELRDADRTRLSVATGLGEGGGELRAAIFAVCDTA
jgi:hypothetical protein